MLPALGCGVFAAFCAAEHPTLSTDVLAGVFGQASIESGTPSLSASALLSPVPPEPAVPEGVPPQPGVT